MSCDRSRDRPAQLLVTFVMKEATKDRAHGVQTAPFEDMEVR